MESGTRVFKETLFILKTEGSKRNNGTFEKGPRKMLYGWEKVEYPIYSIGTTYFHFSPDHSPPSNPAMLQLFKLGSYSLWLSFHHASLYCFVDRVNHLLRRGHAFKGVSQNVMEERKLRDSPELGVLIIPHILASTSGPIDTYIYQFYAPA